VPISQLLEVCKGFLIHEANRKGVRVQIDTLYVSKIIGDELQLMRLFYNLLRNAIKYSDPRERDKFIHIYISSNGRHNFVLSLSDNGIGVPPGEEEHIFGMFERGSNAADYFPEGSGMGLAFCRAIMKRHGGDVALDSDQTSKPTIFHLTFPKSRRSVEP
jgi:signal transduction histidine kinase